MEAAYLFRFRSIFFATAWVPILALAVTLAGLTLVPLWLGRSTGSSILGFLRLPGSFWLGVKICARRFASFLLLRWAPRPVRARVGTAARTTCSNARRCASDVRNLQYCLKIARNMSKKRGSTSSFTSNSNFRSFCAGCCGTCSLAKFHGFSWGRCSEVYCRP